jgi:hypothetical protein
MIGYKIVKFLDLASGMHFRFNKEWIVKNNSHIKNNSYSLQAGLNQPGARSIPVKSFVGVKVST